MALAAARAMYDDLHKDRPFHDGSWDSWVKERSSSHPFHYLDGVTIAIGLTDADPGDDFTTRENARPSLLDSET